MVCSFSADIWLHPMNCEPMQLYIVWVSEYVSIRQALPHAGESLGAGVIDRTMVAEDWMRKEFDIRSSSVQGERSEGPVLFFLIAPSLTHVANEHIQSMARPSRTSGTAFTTRVKSKVPSAQSESNGGTPHASARCMDVNDRHAEGVCVLRTCAPIYVYLIKWEITEKTTISLSVAEWQCWLVLCCNLFN